MAAFIVKHYIGIFAALGFSGATTFSVVFMIIFQIIVLNLGCAVFLKLANEKEIKSVYDKYCLADDDNSEIECNAGVKLS